MNSSIFVAGTGTDVGKTWGLTRLITELRARGHEIRVRKPAQSFAPSELGTTDAELLGEASSEPATVVCPAHRWYETPMAPPMAAAVLGRPRFTIADLVVEIDPPPNCFIEGAGGPRSPIAADGDNVDLARAIGTGLVVLVANAGLGTINAVELSVTAFHGFEVIVFVNRFERTDELHRRNREWLAEAGHRIETGIDALADYVGPRLS
ncbi:MAG: dethiobiotin synthase [Acidimicrobiia bacterium]